MTVHEPLTLATDYLLAALAAWLSWRLHHRSAPKDYAARWFARALALTGLSAFVGGSYHGFAPELPVAVARTWWVLTLLILCLVSAALAMSLRHELAPRNSRSNWTTVIVVKLLVAGGLVLVHPAFLVAVVDYGVAMLLWAAAAVIARRPWRGWMLAAIGLSITAALVQQLRVAPAPFFNHNDFYHVIQAVALIAFYRGALKLGRIDSIDRADLPKAPTA